MRRILLLIFLLGIFFLFLHPIDNDGDFFQHLIIGRSALTNMKLPLTDVFTYTATGHEYIGYAWASGVLFYLIYHALGPVGINIFVSFVAVITFLLLYLVGRTLTKSDMVLFPLLSLSAIAVSSRFPTRPEIMTYPFLLTLLYVNQIRQNRPNLVLLFPFIILLWGWFYGASLLVGLGILLLILMDVFLKPHTAKSQRKLLITSCLACIPAALLNGYGLKSLTFFILLPHMTQILGDWAGIAQIVRTPDYLLVAQYRLFLYGLYLAVMASVIVLSRKTLKGHWMWVTLGLSAFVPVVAFRLLPLSVLLTFPLLVVILSSLPRQRYTIPAIWAVVLVCLFIALKNNPIGTGIDTNTFPESLISYFKERTLSGRAFNSQRVGAFISYNLYPDVLTYSDTRDDLFLSTHALTDLRATLSRHISIEPLLTKYQVDFVIADLTEGRSYEPLFYSARWAPVFSSERYVVFLPKQTILQKHLRVLHLSDPFAGDTKAL